MRFIVFVFLIVLVSCQENKKTECKEFTKEQYTIEVRYNSILECENFERIILTAGYPRYRKIKIDTLYKISAQPDCKKYDTTVIALSKSSRDSLFDLANHFIENFKVNIHYEICGATTKSVRTDPVYAEVKVCESTQCKSVIFDFTNSEKEIHENFSRLANFIYKKK